MKAVNKERRGLKKKKKVILFKSIVAFILFIILFIILILGFYWIRTERVDDNNFWKSKSTTNIYDKNNNFITSYGEYNIDYVPLNKVSQDYLNALIATEDPDFYKHHGVDFKSIIRATFQTVFTTSDSGGSTITMQLAKNLYLQGTQEIDKDGQLIYTKDGQPVMDYPFHGPFDYKLKQMVYAWKIEMKYSKDQILENYVNFLGFDGVTGIENASEYYFGVSADKLTLSESATLAGMTQSPANLNPITHIDDSLKRRDAVLENMLDKGYITQKEFKAAKNEDIESELVHLTQAETNADFAVYRPFLDVVNQEMIGQFGSDFEPATAGVNIYTTLDPDIQKATYDEINNKNGDIRYIDDKIQAGSVSLNSQNGEILAIGGGRTIDGQYPKQNYGAFYQRQPGSTSKPVVDYGPALEYLGWSTAHELVDQQVHYSSGSSVKNAYDGYLGSMSIQEGLARSSNTIALQTFQQVENTVGIGAIEQFMQNLGISDSQNINEAYSIGGWDAGTTSLELSGAYAAFANGGFYNEPHAIRYVKFNKTSPYYEKYKDTDGKCPYDYESHRAMSESTAYMITKMLDPTLPYALTDEMYISSAGTQGIKTGTSNWDKNDYGIPEGSPRDKWVAGYNGDATTVVWSGYDGSDEAKGDYFNDYGYWSYDIYKGIMENIYNDPAEYLHNDSIDKPSDVYSENVGGVNYYFKDGSSDSKTIKKTYKEAPKSTDTTDKSVESSNDGDTTKNYNDTNNDNKNSLQQTYLFPLYWNNSDDTIANQKVLKFFNTL